VTRYVLESRLSLIRTISISSIFDFYTGLVYGRKDMRIKDIAHEAGVSTATVSHVINKTKYVADHTRERVQQAIKKFNYHPNAHAQSLALGKSKIIGLLVSDIANPFFPEIIKSIEAAVIAGGYNLFLLNTNYETERTLEYVHRLIQMKVAGIILMIAEFDDALVAEAKRRKQVCISGPRRGR